MVAITIYNINIQDVLVELLDSDLVWEIRIL